MVKARLIRFVPLAVSLLSTAAPERRDGNHDETPEAVEWRHFNERCASDSLKTLTPAEPDFVANDRDWDHVNDFWTTDLKGLYTLTPAAEPPK